MSSHRARNTNATRAIAAAPICRSSMPTIYVGCCGRIATIGIVRTSPNRPMTVRLRIQNRAVPRPLSWYASDSNVVGKNHRDSCDDCRVRPAHSLVRRSTRLWGLPSSRITWVISDGTETIRVRPERDLVSRPCTVLGASLRPEAGSSETVVLHLSDDRETEPAMHLAQIRQHVVNPEVGVCNAVEEQGDHVVDRCHVLQHKLPTRTTFEIGVSGRERPRVVEGFVVLIAWPRHARFLPDLLHRFASSPSSECAVGFANPGQGPVDIDDGAGIRPVAVFPQ